MSESKHTPGPWVCASGMVWVYDPSTWAGGDTESTKEAIPIARMDREPGNGTAPWERDANAHLIAAAPELLEAAEMGLGLIEAEHSSMSDGTPETEVENEVWKLRAAINKARSEAA